ncbi:sensor histidine kinase [Actinomadura sp. 9N407]|uniref:sensor histidine kinase n=1 Tax=Actinomadura sp. 9N407 TaxID=3375154 RepID=UPI0037ABDE58
MSAQRSGLHPRTARTIAVAVLASLVAVYVLASADGPPRTVAAVVPLSAAILLLQFRYVFPGLRRFQTRGVMVVQAVLTYLVVVPFGVTTGMLGLLAGALLLSSAWRTAVLVIGSVVVIAGFRADAPPGHLDLTITAILTALVAYGLCRLTDRIEAVFAARLTLAVTAVEEERLRMAAELDEGIGRGLDAIAGAADRPGELDGMLAAARGLLTTARTSAADLRSLSLAPEVATARGLLAAADVDVTVRIGHSEPLGQAGALIAAVLRQAVTDVVRQGTARTCLIETAERDGLLTLRVTSDGVATAAQGAEAMAPLAERVRAAGGRLTAGLDPDGRFTVSATVKATAPPAVPPSGEHRLSVILLAVVLAGFCAKALLQMSLWEQVAAVPALVAICAIQLRWTRPQVTHWAWPLAAQVALTYVPLLWYGEAWGGTAGFLAGSLLVLLPAAVAAPLVAAVMASLGIIAWALGQPTPVVVNSVVSVLVTGLVTYGLVRLARLADELRDAAAGIARGAIVQERLRAARDLHDLLGHGLAAIMLKGELARRLLPTDPGRARAELADVAAMAVRARADMETVAGAAPRLEFEPELESVRSVLAAAGVEVRVDWESAPAAGAEAVLSVVLREAVTNVLRHSTARRVEIEVGAGRLVVENDGAPAATAPPGSGIGNLGTRLSALGGRLDARPLRGGRFRVVAELEPAERPLDPAGLAGDADGVDAAPGVQLGDDRREVVADRPRR